MKKLVYIAIFFINLTVVAQRQQPPKVVLADFPSKIKPGHLVTLFFNTEFKKEDGITVDLYRPEKWQLILTKEIETASKNLKYIVTFSTDKFSNSGKYKIRVNFMKQGKIVVSKPMNIEIEEIRNINLTTLNKPEYIKSGDTLSVEYLLENFGNQEETIFLSSNRGWIVTGDSIKLAPNSQTIINAKQVVPQTKDNYWITSNDVQAKIKGSDAVVIQSVSVPVFSNSSTKVDTYHRIPTQMGVNYLYFTLDGKPQSAIQYVATGSGFLDMKEKHGFDFQVRGPNNLDLPQIGSYDQYSFEYNHKKQTKIFLGDFNNQVSNLTEFSRFGRGIAIEQKVKKFEFRTFYQNARFFLEQKNSIGAGIRYKYSDKISFGINFTNKGLVKKEIAFRTNLVGLNSEFVNSKGKLVSEIALGNAKGKTDIGIYNRFNYQLSKLTINSETVFAGKNFHGFYNNSRLFINSVNYQFNRKFGMGVNSNFTLINPALDLLMYATAPFSRSTTFFTSWFPNQKQMIFLNLTNQEREDRRDPSTFHYTEDFMNLSYSLNADKVSLFAQTRYGSAINHLAEDAQNSGKSISYMAQPMVRIRPWMWVGGYFEQQITSKYNIQNKLEHLYYYGGNARINFKSYVNLNFTYRNNFAPDEFFQKKSFMDASLEFDFKRHNLSLVSGKAFIPGVENSNQNTTYFSLRYVLKLNIPTVKNRKIGSVKGKIFGFNTIESNLGGLLIQMGQYRSLTDNEGNFAFNNILPDKYHITVVPNEKLIGMIPERKDVLDVVVKEDSVHMVNIPYIKTGGVVGKVSFELDERDQTINKEKEKPVVLLKLENGTESFVTRINTENEFSFKEIKPGEWKIKVILTGNTEGFEVSEEEKIVNIESEKISNADFTVKQNQRKIFFSNKEFKLSVKK
ncbi:MAG: hypothetical protein LCH67_06425 [Bacteroidetes bacterium]|nr:hypothetical protein [Bacteroidota bacterium]